MQLRCRLNKWIAYNKASTSSGGRRAPLDFCNRASRYRIASCAVTWARWSVDVDRDIVDTYDLPCRASSLVSVGKKDNLVVVSLPHQSDASGRRGILSLKVITLLRRRHHISSSTQLRVVEATGEDATNDAIQQSLFHFYFELQDISLQVSCLNRHHRSRGTLKDERDVETISKSLEQQLQYLWEGRPVFVDVLKLVACLCRICYQAELISHTRAYDRSQPISLPISNARVAIRQGIEQVSQEVALHPAFMWPLFMYAVETTDGAELDWALETLNSISDSWWNSRVLTDLATGVGKEQLKTREGVSIHGISVWKGLGLCLHICKSTI
ncbi:hypothetical protein HZ326_18293 [Fusarium oxysporum f. sp. albedinis]|nr:Uncharacterized protein HZ326_28117 [Fusarium oxysporum f. sp. albedinis]KAJ0138774.1 hypothetical protein HZ326_18293 [Fusarium oxysporum f. sp. albedinis]